jgi:hypothetical protein
MAGVTATRYVQIGGKRTPVKAIKGTWQRFPQAVIEATAVQLRIIAEESRELVIDRILAGTAAAPAGMTVQRPPVLRKSGGAMAQRKAFKLAPLTRPYVLKKAREGLDGRTLTATGDYINGIVAKRAEIPGAGVAYGVGMESRNHVPSGLPLSVLAGILELGSAAANIPPRPHWRSARRQVMRRLKQLAPDVRAAVLREALRGIA